MKCFFFSFFLIQKQSNFGFLSLVRLFFTLYRLELQLKPPHHVLDDVHSYQDIALADHFDESCLTNDRSSLLAVGTCNEHTKKKIAIHLIGFCFNYCFYFALIRLRLLDINE